MLLRAKCDPVLHRAKPHLPNPTDLLPAVAGIARRFSNARNHKGEDEQNDNKLGDQYLAGLWRWNLEHELYWKSVGWETYHDLTGDGRPTKDDKSRLNASTGEPPCKGCRVGPTRVCAPKGLETPKSLEYVIPYLSIPPQVGQIP
jgi:hypothetical protein